MAKKEITKKATATSKKTVSKTTKAAPKKTAPKTSVKTRAQVQSHAVKESTKEIKKTESVNQPVKFSKSYVIVAVLIVILGVLLYVGRGLFVAAVVNGQPISRLSVVKEAEKQAGKQALDTMIRNTLIEQEARKQNITVSQDEIDIEIKKIDAQMAQQGKKLDDVLAMQNMTRDQLNQLIRIQKIVEKIVGKDVTVSDKEVDDYLEQNKAMLPQDQSEDQLRKTAAASLKQNKINEKVRNWLESIQTKAKIMYFVQY